MADSGLLFNLGTSRGIPWRRLVAGTLALAGSLLLHGAALSRFPSVPVGAAVDIDRTRQDYRTEIDRVDLQPTLGPNRPETFSLPNPEEAASLPVEPDVFTETWSPPEVPAEQLVQQAVTADVSAEPLPERQERVFRQELLEIKDPAIPDDQALLPRRVEPEAPRVRGALDWSPPSDLDEMGSVLTGGGASPSTGGGLGFGMQGAFPDEAVLPPLGQRDTASRTTMAELEPETSLLDEAAEVLDEPVEEISDSDAVEDMLQLVLLTEQVPGDPYMYFELQILRSGAEALPVLPKDVLLIQDASMSMTQRKLDVCKEGILKFLETLRPVDRFNIVTFRDKIEYAFEEWRVFDGTVIPRTRFFLRDLEAEGKTDVSGTLDQVFKMPREPGRPVLAVLLTDGRPTQGLVDESDIIVHLSDANQGNVSVFALGGGKKVNRFLLEMLSYKNHGDAMIVEERDAIPSAMERWGRQLSRPVLTDLDFRFSGLPDADVFPKSLTHLFLDRPLKLFGRIRDPEASAAFRIEGFSGDLRRDLVFPLDFPDLSESSAGRIRQQWARHKVIHLIGEHVRTQDGATLQEIRHVKEKYGIDVPYAREWLFFGL